MPATAPRPGTERPQQFRRPGAARTAALAAVAAAAAVVAPGASWSGAVVTYAPANTFDLNPAVLGGNAGSLGYGAFGAEQVGAGSGDGTAGATHALLWAGTPAGGAVDLHPASLLGPNSVSRAYATAGGQQVGYGTGDNTANNLHALLWAGTAASAVDLHPGTLFGGNSSSYALATSGTRQAGYGSGDATFGYAHALVWAGTAASAVDLNPALLGGSANSFAYGASGDRQVGYGYGEGTASFAHALLWAGTAASAVDLHPVALLGAGSTSYALGTSGGQQVGYGVGPNTSGDSHALLWTGTAASAVDLHPAALLGDGSISVAYATSGDRQVGAGSGAGTAGNTHALAWAGTAASAVDLHALLPPGFLGSQARAIDAYGNVVGYAYNDTVTHAVAWLAGDMYNVATGSGAWGTAANWTAGVPAAGGDVLLVQQDATSRTVTYTIDATAAPLGNVTIDATGSGTLTLDQTAGTFSATNETVGVLGSGAVTQAGGTHLVADTLALAGRPGASAAYTLSGTGVLNAGALVVNAGATFTQNGGTLVTGSLTQSGGTIAGTVTSAGTFTYNAGSFTGRLVNAGTAVLTAPFTAGNGIENDGDLRIGAATPVTANGAGLDNFGTLTLDGGLLAGTGPVTNDVGGVMTARGTVAPAFTNYGRLSTSGLLVLSAASSNAGQITLASGQGLRAGAALANSGPITLNGGSISGAGTVTNLPGGSITGAGGVSNPLANSGGLVQTGASATLFLGNLTTNSAGGGLVVGAGSQLTVASAFPSSGFVQLVGPGSLLSGGAIANSGTIKGAGQVANPITNNGVIRAEGGELDLTGAVTNPAAGLIQADAGTTVFVTQGLATNAGTVALAGGTFDANNQPLANTGTINGHGTLRTGTLTNAGSVFLANGDAAIYGPLVNNAGAAVRLASAAATFYRPVTNNGTFSLTAATATFSGGFAGTAPSAPDGLVVSGAATSAASPALAGSLGVDAASSLLATHVRQDAVTSAGAIVIRPISQGGDTSAVNTLTLSPGSTFDLADTRLILSSAATPVATLRGYLLAGRLSSSTADADPQHRLALGYVDNALLNASSWGGLPADASNLLVKLTYQGDANLDGRITADDYALLDKGFAQRLPTWTFGDFDYDGQVTSADYLLIDRTYTLQSGTYSPGAVLLAERESQFGAEYVSLLLTSIPEPSSLACLFAAFLPLTRRRRPTAPR